MDILTNGKVTKLWSSEIEKKLFRCSKELGVYSQIKKSLGKFDYCDSTLWKIKKFDFLCCELWASLQTNRGSIIAFENMGVKFTYPVPTALNDERHFCHLLVLHIIMKASLKHDVSQKLFQDVSKEIFKHHRLHTKCIRIKSFFKIFFS